VSLLDLGLGLWLIVPHNRFGRLADRSYLDSFREGGCSSAGAGGNRSLLREIAFPDDDAGDDEDETDDGRGADGFAQDEGDADHGQEGDQVDEAGDAGGASARES
jgi:hypothetical protein